MRHCLPLLQSVLDGGGTHDMQVFFDLVLQRVDLILLVAFLEGEKQANRR